ncbi:MAG: RsmB/NOP family class I SAM-dependent RNA methyltransferase [Proteobacteria bacterium]|nr:RsmB/NOP family class I SAM-dependent RNA methyltransferase [Pseudomonadota bacterium]
MTPAARLEGAIELLEYIDAAPRKPADAVANAFFRDRRYIGSGDRRALSERVWSVLRARSRLSWWLERTGGAPSPRLLAAASLVFDGWTPDSVIQAFSGGRFAPARLGREEAAAIAGLAGHTLEHPAMPDFVLAEAPEWIMPSLRARFGDRLRAEMAAMLDKPTLDLRVNLLKASRADAQAALAAEGLDAQPTPHSPWGLRLHGRHQVTTGPAFREGLVEIQDEGSQLVAALVDARPGMRVADWCAGAGGKTLAIAMTMQNRGQIVACDVSAHRLDGAAKRLRRAGVHNAERHVTVAGDKWAKRRARSFDRVLVDAPCTGTGTWRRNPDARRRLLPSDLSDLVAKQAAILDQAADLVRKSGRLVYATCSLLPEENETQVTGFLERHTDFRIRPLAEPGTLPDGLPTPEALGGGPYLSLTPRSHGTDGFFAAVLERTE